MHTHRHSRRHTSTLIKAHTWNHCCELCLCGTSWPAPLPPQGLPQASRMPQGQAEQGLMLLRASGSLRHPLSADACPGPAAGAVTRPHGLPHSGTGDRRAGAAARGGVIGCQPSPGTGTRSPHRCFPAKCGGRLFTRSPSGNPPPEVKPKSASWPTELPSPAFSLHPLLWLIPAQAMWPLGWSQSDPTVPLRAFSLLTLELRRHLFQEVLPACPLHQAIHASVSSFV